MSTATALETTIRLAKVGQPAPDFNMPSTKNIDTLAENVKLSDYKGKWLILLFYPLDFTFVCPTELINFSDRLEEINGVGAGVLGVSTDDEKSHQKFISKYELPFDLLADTDKNIVEKYGVWGEKSMYGKKYMGTLRKTFLIGEDGRAGGGGAWSVERGAYFFVHTDFLYRIHKKQHHRRCRRFAYRQET